MFAGQRFGWLSHLRVETGPQLSANSFEPSSSASVRFDFDHFLKRFHLLFTAEFDIFSIGISIITGRESSVTLVRRSASSVGRQDRYVLSAGLCTWVSAQCRNCVVQDRSGVVAGDGRSDIVVCDDGGRDLRETGDIVSTYEDRSSLQSPSSSSSQMMGNLL